MNARRYPRTLEAAFGPYHRSSVCPIEPMQSATPGSPAARIALRITYALALIVLALVLIFD